MPTNAAAAILVVDEDEGARKELRAALERQGYRVTEAESGRAALESLAEDPGEPPRLVVIDADEDRELTRLLRVLAPARIPVIATSASPPEDDDDREIAAWARKPYDMAQLIGLVKARARA
jgi:DNA-binding response OmpR family regulator